MEPESVYENVDRAIYEPGGVGLTSDSIRSDPKYYAVQQISPYLSALPYVSLGLTAAASVALGISLRYMVTTGRQIAAYNANIARLSATLKDAERSIRGLQRMIQDTALETGDAAGAMARYKDALNAALDKASNAEAALNAAKNPELIGRLSARSSTCKKLSAGFGVAVILLIALTTYLTWRDLVNHYKIDFTPIPRFMVDEKDITVLNARGEKIVIKNQQAYYRAVECNRDTSAEFYKVLGTCADLNGDVGKQWLAIYYAKNEAEMPILANSLKAVIDNKQIPAGYTEGVHMFGVGAAENINNPLYVWDSDAKSIYLYYMHAEEKDVSLAGTGFTAGTIALSAGAGLAVGALTSAFAVSSISKRKRKEEQTE